MRRHTRRNLPRRLLGVPPPREGSPPGRANPARRLRRPGVAATAAVGGGSGWGSTRRLAGLGIWPPEAPARAAREEGESVLSMFCFPLSSQPAWKKSNTGGASATSAAVRKRQRDKPSREEQKQGLPPANEPPFRSPPLLPSPRESVARRHGGVRSSSRGPRTPSTLRPARSLPGGLVACLGPHQAGCAPSSGGGWSRSDPIQGIPHLLELDPAQVAAVKGAIDDGACPLDPLSDASDSDSDSSGGGDDEESDHPPKQGKAVSSSPVRQLRQGNDLLHRLLWKERNKHMFSSERRMAQDVIFAILKKGGCEEPLSTIDNVMCHNL
ncbi:uncharacterized protein LOC125535156 [Triticum urartu]|uniref:uncharacterized protein LOC125535156 n=1 Tax=Triticum urartu TaxID=4572 RepID=UPI0020446045|nr:uncharacterized protein LOC125535156 [Triticum urartu]